jgi:dTMP kinase
LRGLFITFEGPDGSGKSTQVDLLARALAGRQPVVVREPGGTALGERIRELLLHRVEGMSALAEMYLFMAARAELLEATIKPALAAGRVVIDDRYQDSTIAYQGGGRGVDAGWPSHFPKPDLTVLLTLPPEEGISRIRRSAKALDRLDAESLPFHRAVAAAYDRLADAEPGRFLRVEARAMPEDIHVQVMERVKLLL